MPHYVQYRTKEEHFLQFLDRVQYRLDVFPVNEGWLYPYLVFKIFKNCKISENCINLSALRNLKPARKRLDREREKETD